MCISNYFATSIRLSLLLLSFLLFSCISPEETSSNLTTTSAADIVSPTSASETVAANPNQFSYIVRVSDRDTQESIQGAEVSILLNKEAIDTTNTDTRGQGVFVLKIEQANQKGELVVKAEGYREEIFNIALRVDSPPEEVQLSLLTQPPSSTDTATPPASPTDPSISPSTETPILTPDDTPTSLPTDTPIPSPTDTPPPTSTATPAAPTGNLAIPVVFNFGTKIYLTGFDGAGINGPNEVSIGGEPGSEDARQPMFSQDGKSLMVKATLDGVIGLHKLTASGFNPEIIIRRGSAEWPVLSPLDGRIVLFSESTLNYRLHKRLASDEIETKDENIEEISLNGFPIFAKNLLWSEDNQLIFQGCAVWINDPGTCGTWVTDANNLNPRRIIVGNEAQPMAIRRDTLAYVSRVAGEDWEIHVMSISSGETKNITDNNFEDGLPAISPEGDAIAYISNESGKWGLWTINLDGQNKQHWFDIDSVRGVFDINQWDKERMSWRQ